MYSDHEGHLRHDATRRDEWGREMLAYLREHDLHFERLRHETLRQMDEDYLAWRRGKATTVAPQEPVTEPTSMAASPDPAGVAMPLPSSQLSERTIVPDADAAARQAAVQQFHGEPTAPGGAALTPP